MHRGKCLYQIPFWSVSPTSSADSVFEIIMEIVVKVDKYQLWRNIYKTSFTQLLTSNNEKRRQSANAIWSKMAGRLKVAILIPPFQ